MIERTGRFDSVSTLSIIELSSSVNAGSGPPDETMAATSSDVTGAFSAPQDSQHRLRRPIAHVRQRHSPGEIATP